MTPWRGGAIVARPGVPFAGSVGEKEKLPWNSKLARNINYRATVETLLTIL